MVRMYVRVYVVVVLLIGYCGSGVACLLLVLVFCVGPIVLFFGRPQMVVYHTYIHTHTLYVRSGSNIYIVRTVPDVHLIGIVGFLLYAAGADDGIEEIRASGMILQCFQTVTGIKFVITVAVPDPPNHNSNNNNNINEPLVSSTLRDVLKEIYVLYTECVLKDPFYELEMPIRSDLFVQGVDLLIQHKYTTILQKVVTTPPTTTTMSGSYSNTLHTTTTTPSSSKILY